MNPPRIVDAWIEQGLNEMRQVPDAQAVHRLCWCPASGALPSGLDPPPVDLSAVVRDAVMDGDLDHATALTSTAQLDLPQREALLDAMRARDKLPTPDGAIGPLRIAYCDDGQVKLVHHDGLGERLPEKTILTGRIDLMWATPELRRVGRKLRADSGAVLSVASYQSDLPSVFRPYWTDASSVVLTMMGARLVGAKYARPVTISIGSESGELLEGPVSSVHDLRAHELQTRDVLATLEYQRHLADQAEPLRFRHGLHCSTCPASWCCPVMLVQLKKLLDEPVSFIEDDLDEEEARRLVILHEQAQALERRARSALRRHVTRHGPIRTELGTWEGVQTIRRLVDPVVGYRLLKKLYGQNIAEEALLMPKSKVLRALSQARKSGLLKTTAKSAAAELYEKLDQQGGLRPITQITYGLHHPIEEHLGDEFDDPKEPKKP